MAQSQDELLPCMSVYLFLLVVNNAYDIIVYVWNIVLVDIYKQEFQATIMSSLSSSTCIVSGKHLAFPKNTNAPRRVIHQSVIFIISHQLALVGARLLKLSLYFMVIMT